LGGRGTGVLRRAVGGACTRAAHSANERHEPALAVRLAREATRRTYCAEPPVRELMRGLDANGERSQALQAYQSLRAAMLDELGVEPGGDTQDLYLAILRGNPAERTGRPTATRSAPCSSCCVARSRATRESSPGCRRWPRSASCCWPARADHLPLNSPIHGLVSLLALASGGGTAESGLGRPSRRRGGSREHRVLHLRPPDPFGPPGAAGRAAPAQAPGCAVRSTSPSCTPSADCSSRPPRSSVAVGSRRVVHRRHRRRRANRHGVRPGHGREPTGHGRLPGRCRGPGGRWTVCRSVTARPANPGPDLARAARGPRPAGPLVSGPRTR
jgi:hypothetical protein